MAKGNSRSTRPDGATAIKPPDPTAETIEHRVAAFAEQLGRIAGTIQAKAEGWLDGETLNKQLASVRDGAAQLLEQLAGRVGTAAKRKPAPAAGRGGTTGRSGGVVDAPGKRHRKQAPPDPGANVVRSQAAKMRTALPMAKTNRRRGRG